MLSLQSSSPSSQAQSLIEFDTPPNEKSRHQESIQDRYPDVDQDTKYFAKATIEKLQTGTQTERGMVFRRLIELSRHWQHPEATEEFLNELVNELNEKSLFTDLDLSGHDFTDIDLSGLNLCYADFSHATLNRVNFFNSNLHSATLYNATLQGAELSDAILEDANLRNTILINANLARCNLFGANLTEANLTETNLTRANLCSANLSNTTLIDAILFKADITDTDFTDAKFREGVGILTAISSKRIQHGSQEKEISNGVIRQARQRVQRKNIRQLRQLRHLLRRYDRISRFSNTEKLAIAYQRGSHHYK